MTTGPKNKRSAMRPGKTELCENGVGIESKRIRTEYPVVQQRGQRRYGPPVNWKGEEPSKGAELFVSKLPKDLLENELIPIFERLGPLYEIRLIMDTLVTNKGFAFVKYLKKDDAEIALFTLNDYEIRPNCHICVTKSLDNNRIFIGNIPKHFSEDTLMSQMQAIVGGVVKAILYPSVNDRAKNRGYGFVEFESHQMASAARLKLISTPVLWDGQEVKVDWAEPEITVDEEIMKKVKVLYVRNLALTTSEQQLQELFSECGQIERVRKLKDYAFIHFATREQAEQAKKKYKGYALDGCEIDISWSKPVTNKEEYQQRKAMSKAMLSSPGPISHPLAALSVHGDPILLNQRIRNAAGSQAIAGRQMTPLSQVQPVIAPAFVPTIPLKANHSEVTLNSGLQAVFPVDRLAPGGEEVLHDASVQLANPVQPWISSQYMVPQVPTNWPSPAPPYQSTLPQQNFISTTYFVQPQFSQPIFDGQYAHYPCSPQFYTAPLMTPAIAGMNGSNMSVDRI